MSGVGDKYELWLWQAANALLPHSYILWKLMTPTITWPNDKVNKDKVDKVDKVDKMDKVD